MTIYSFWIYDRHCNCVYSREYTHKESGSQRNSIVPSIGAGSTSASLESTHTSHSSLHTVEGGSSVVPGGSINVRNDDDLSKFMFGIFFSLRKISNHLVARKDAPADEFASGTLNSSNHVTNFTTLNYKCHVHETLSGLKLIVVTDMECRNLNSELAQLFNTVYVSKVVANAASHVDFRAGECIDNEPFVEGVDRFWSGLVEFA